MTEEDRPQAEIDEEFRRQIHTDFYQLVAYCAPGHAEQVSEIMREHWGNAVEVKVSTFITNPHQVILIDEQGSQAVAAKYRQYLDRNGL